MFTSSGSGFVFDNLKPAAAATEDGLPENQTISRTGSGSSFAPLNPVFTTTTTHPTLSIRSPAKRKIEILNESGGALDGEGGKPDVTSFIDSFHHEGRTTPSAIIHLEAMLRLFPDLVWLSRSVETGELEVLFQRDKLIKALRHEEDKFPALVFTSFERGLKHAGMEVTQSTHGQVTIKKWAMKKGFVPKPVGPKRPRKKDLDDEDYSESTEKKARLSAPPCPPPPPTRSSVCPGPV